MRKGQNPAKEKIPAYQPQKVGVAVVSYIPSLGGYFEKSLEILKLEIASLHKSTGVPFDLYIFDNGSCVEARSELFHLQGEGWIDFLFVARHNLGKIGCLNWILGSVPNELICYADSDVLFRPGWYEKSLAILDSFPHTGLVAAQPCLDDVLRGKGQAQTIFDDQSRFRVELQTIDPRWVDEYATGFGYSPEKAENLKKSHYPMVTNIQTGVQAVIGASHVQFMIPREVARQIVPLPATMSLSRKEDLNLNQTVDRKGYLHLSTMEPYYYHMGNTLDKNSAEAAASMGLNEFLETSPHKNDSQKMTWWLRLLKRLARFPVFGSIIYRSYKLLFEIYSQ
jgi:hypothetical protein